MLGDLPGNVRQQAKEAYKQFQKDPFHPGINSKGFIQAVQSMRSVSH